MPGHPVARNRVWQMDLMDAHRSGQITDEQLLAAPTGTSRTPRIRVHPTCHQPILAGLDANRCALSVAVDPYPLTPAGEVWALQSGRRTYALMWGALERRDAWTIPGHPPSPGLPVLAEHVCESPIPMEHRAPPTPPRPTVTPEEF